MIVNMTNIDDLLEKALSDSPIVQRIAIAELSPLCDVRAADVLVQVMHTANRSVRVQAARALAKIGTGAVSHLIGVLNADNRDSWTLASATLLMIGSAAVPGLMDALTGESEQVRLLAVEVLGQIGDTRPIPQLVEILQSDNPALQTAAAAALVRIGPESVQPLVVLMTAFHQPNLRRMVTEIISQIGEDAIAPLMTMLYESSDLERSQVAWLTGSFGSAAVPSLLEALESENASVRYAAATALGQTGDNMAVAGLVNHLTDTAYISTMGKRVCDATAHALEQIGTPDALGQVKSWRLQS